MFLNFSILKEGCGGQERKREKKGGRGREDRSGKERGERWGREGEVVVRACWLVGLGVVVQGLRGG